MSTSKNRIYNPKMEVVSIAVRAKSSQKQKGISLFWAVNQIWQGLLAAAAGENEVRIWQTSDNDGNTRWHGCDRATGRSIDAASDGEMRAWLDRRYCQ